MKPRQVVTVIGWTWVGLGALMFTGGALGLLASFIQDAHGSPLPAHFAPVDFLWRHYRAAAAVQVCLAVVVALSGFMLVRRRAWARVVIQLLSALVIGWLVVFGIYWFRALAAITSAPGSPRAVAAVFRVLMSAGGVVVLGMLAGVFGLCIWALNRPGVREELRTG